MFYLYILQSLKDNKLYVGISKNIEKRLSEHNSGKVKSTKNRRPLIVVFKKSYHSRKEAAQEEWLIKHTPGAGKKKRLMIEEYQKSRAHSSAG